jgi:hypothetical protein
VNGYAPEEQATPITPAGQPTPITPEEQATPIAQEDQAITPEVQAWFDRASNAN